MAGSIEQGQRQALSSLLARFTADRDALITSINGCQQRIGELVARLDAGGAAGPAAGGGAAAPELAGVRAAIAQLQAEQDAALAKVAADAALAIDRADAALGAALGAVQQLGATSPGEPAPAGAPGLGELRTAVESLQAEVAILRGGPPDAAGHVRESEEWRAAVDQLRSELGRNEAKVGERIDAGIRNAARGWDAALATLRAQVEKLDDAAQAAEPAPRSSHDLEEVRAGVGRLEASLGERIDAGIRNAGSGWDTALATLRAQVEKLETGLSAAGGGAPAELKALRDEVARVAAGTAAAEELRTSLAEVRQGLGRMESTMGHYYETMRTTAEGRDAELVQLREQVERLTANLATVSASATAIEELGGAVAQLRGDLGRLETGIGDRLETRMRFAQDGWDAEAKLLHDELRQLVASQTAQAASASSLAEVRAAVEQLRGELSRVHSTLESRLEGRLRAIADASTTETRRLRERVEQLGTDQGTPSELTGGLQELRAAIAALQSDVTRAGTATEARIDAKVRAALEGWNAEGRALRVRLEQVAAARADDGRLATTLTELRATVEHLRTDVGRMDASLDRRVDARVRAVESGWDAEAALLRARIDDLAEQLAQQARADAEDPLRLRLVAVALGRRLAAAQAMAERVPVLRRVAAAVGAVAWILGGAPAKPSPSRT